MLQKFVLKFHFILAFLVRIIFTIAGIYIDSKSTQLNDDSKITPKYTDIDYQVFTDAARHVHQGESPYERDTYRYTPLLATILQPNITLTPSFGKLLFILFDMLCGYLIIKINQLNHDSKSDLESIIFWFYNPITIAISSRGNAESLMAFLVLALIYFVRKENFFLAGLFYAISIHFKIYPVIYGLAILLHITQFKTLNPLRLILNKNLWIFGITFIMALSSITLFFYNKYGYQFLYEAYLYHLVRQDIRHNFSPFFYLLYLTNQTYQNSMLLRLFYVLPQITSILVVSFSFYGQLELCLMCLTFLFVSFNKVCTSQYFVWYLCLLPLIIPRLRIGFLKSLGYFCLWMFGQGLWLYFAFELEFMGNNTFLELWIAGLVFLTINWAVLKYGIIDVYECNSKKNKVKSS